MKTFLLKTIAWTLPGVITCFGLWFGLLCLNPSRDTLGFYRMTPTTCNAMIFGTSRSAQGVNPSIIEKYAPYTGKWLNFSFNLGDSPWNEAYVDAIIQKVQCSMDLAETSYFLIFVDPWSMDEYRGSGEQSWLKEPWASPCGTKIFNYGWRKTNPLDVLNFGSGSDLLSVMASSVTRQMKDALTRQTSFSENSGVQENGWLPNKAEKSMEEKISAIEEKVELYCEDKRIGKVWPYSENSTALIRLIHYLQQNLPKSRVILVRPPVADSMFELEQNWFPETNNWLEELCCREKIEFIDSNILWKDKSTSDFNDGHHMSIEGANRFSQFLAGVIKSDD